MLNIRALRPLQLLALISGVLAFLCFVAVPLMPVKQTQSSFDWPQGSLNSVNAPLISVAPESFTAEIPLASVEKLREGETLLLGTIPPSGPEASDRGLFVTQNKDQGIDVTVLNDVAFQLSAKDLRDIPKDATLSVETTADGAYFGVRGTSYEEETEDDLRPQVTGLYTEIDNSPQNLQELSDAGLSAHVEINSRFTTSPTLIKQVTMWLGTLFAVISLAALFVMERRRASQEPEDGSTPASSLERGSWRRLRPLDGLVGAILGFWHIFGANTSDDGFILTMARVSDHAGYMANYYRWYGVPEAPFGSPFYELLAVMTQVSSNSLWMRVPTLLAGIGIWLLLSREILPRFGAGINGRRVAHWTAAFMFLAFWLPYNNGLRPEPIIAFGVLATWALFERAIATDRFFPAAVATVLATITLTCGPTGLMAVGVFLVSLPSLIRMLARRVSELRTGKILTIAGIIGPFLAAGTFVMVPVFADQSLAAVMESTRVRGVVGPALEWYSEYVRYSTLLEQSVDGSLTRRFAMLTMLVCLGLTLYSLLRHGRVTGAAVGPTSRLVIIMGLSMFFLMFTPTKWTHHFGIYAGVAGALAALGAVVLSQIAIRSPRARTFSLAGVTFLMALTFAGWNGWWYVSSFGVPWWDKVPQLKGVEFTTLIMLMSLVILAVGIFQSFRHDLRRSQAIADGRGEEFEAAQSAKAYRWAGVMSAPVAVVSILVVTFSVLTFTKAFVDQYPAYSVGMGNVKALGGNTSYLADEAMLETNTNDSFLTPLGDVPLGESLETNAPEGFEPSQIPESIVPKTKAAANVGAIANTQVNDNTTNTTGAADSQGLGTSADSGKKSQDSSSKESSASTNGASQDVTGGVRETKGVNGSTARLPFNLDPYRVPVLGSYDENATTAAEATTSWYHLPEATDKAPLLVVSVAGKIAHHDINGVEQPGEDFVLEYGTAESDGSAKKLGELEMLDIGPTPSWRNLRIPLDEIPEEANVVRLHAKDASLDPEDWIAFTPPRAPELAQLSQLYDDSKPALLDWSVALQFPQQRTFDHFAGVSEIPEYRIAPDNEGKAVLTGFMDFYGGGALATVEAVNTSFEVPSYTRGDWHRDWGSLEHYELRRDSAGNTPDLAAIDYETITRSGLWHPSDMQIRDPEKAQETGMR
ncbi:arabinosyltransferase domain-containing protein [Corynebacterium tapiri]|uniref:Arabinosyltransferase n=1 Tax=Corynebacterium tapiri TaxID=1448266 RepID=A0A5C4U166_9CORY|nr:arabinosyltransferase domain-containing protein [Corynebacterium tapiri]TNL94847.1 arabinosyltransferase [Corynebacterium tapiri]